MRKVALWTIAFLITVSTAIFQRKTGPTYPLSGKILFNHSEIRYTLARSHETQKDCELAIDVPDQEISGYLIYRRHKTSDAWTRVPMDRKDDRLSAFLPHQPPAGKLEYRVILEKGEREISLSDTQPIIIRFKGHVPEAVLIPHILMMFLAMLLSTRAGIEALGTRSNPRRYALWAAGLLFIGGMILGPVVQKYAFGSYWTGFPLGFDLTDNKTLIAMIGWTAAVVAGRGGKPARGWVIGASILLLAVYLIPHSLLGSELDYSQMDAPPGLQE